MSHTHNIPLHPTTSHCSTRHRMVCADAVLGNLWLSQSWGGADQRPRLSIQRWTVQDVGRLSGIQRRLLEESWRCQTDLMFSYIFLRWFPDFVLGDSRLSHVSAFFNRFASRCFVLIWNETVLWRKIRSNHTSFKVEDKSAVLPRVLPSGGVCLEKNASTLRSFAPWKEWINSIRSYGTETSKLLGGKQEALILAQAMEDNGCGFLANLSAQNISLGGCFSWNSKFSWDFKTLEVFCPLTCGCAELNSAASGCPEPFGKSCDQLKWYQCLTWNDQHFCPGFNTKIINAMIMYNYASTDLLYHDETSVSLL